MLQPHSERVRRSGGESSLSSNPGLGGGASLHRTASIPHDSWFGSKTIKFFPGVALLINNITGPGVPQVRLL